MIERIVTVGGFTLLSRASGFARDIILAAVLGAGPVADAFFVAVRLPHHLRATFTAGVIEVLAPGFSKAPGRFTLAVELTRITFPYLLLVTLVTLYGGILNALDRFAAAAAAPVLLHLSMVMA